MTGTGSLNCWLFSTVCYLQFLVTSGATKLYTNLFVRLLRFSACFPVISWISESAQLFWWLLQDFKYHPQLFYSPLDLPHCFSTFQSLLFRGILQKFIRSCRQINFFPIMSFCWPHNFAEFYEPYLNWLNALGNAAGVVVGSSVVASFVQFMVLELFACNLMAHTNKLESTLIFLVMWLFWNHSFWVNVLGPYPRKIIIFLLEITL